MLGNPDLTRLNLHCGLQTLAICMAGAFSAAFLLRQGLSPSAVFLIFGAVLALRFVLRPLALWSAPRLGLKTTLALGCLLTAGQYAALAQVRGLDGWLVGYCLIGGLGNVYYWTTLHALIAALSDSARMGRQVAFRQILTTLASVAGPIAGGALLAGYGPWAAFGAAAAIMLVSAAPLLAMREPGMALIAPEGAFAAGRSGALLFSTDGWINNAGAQGWAMAAFLTLGERYDAYGWLLAGAALAGAAGGFVLGRFIDLGHGRRAVAVNAALGCLLYAAMAYWAETPTGVVILSVTGTLYGALYIPSLLAVVYRRAKETPCVFRFHFMLEGGWDAGGVAACLAGAAITALGAPLALAIALAPAAVLVQGAMLARAYPREA